MVASTKPVNKIVVIKEKDSERFKNEFNKNQVSKEFLESCKKAGRLLDKKKQYNI